MCFTHFPHRKRPILDEKLLFEGYICTKFECMGIMNKDHENEPTTKWADFKESRHCSEPIVLTVYARIMIYCK